MAATNRDISMAVNIPPNAPQHVYAASAEQALAWDRADGALEVCELGLERHPGYTGLRLFRAEALFKHNRLDEAEADLRAVLAAEPQHPRAVKAMCYLLMDQRRYRDALRFLQRAEFLLLDDAEITEWLGVAEARADEQPDPAAPPPNSLISPALQARVHELTSLPGVKTVQVVNGGDERVFGNASPAAARDLSRMEPLEKRMAAVLLEAGFGDLTDVSLQTENTIWTSHHASAGAVRVAADATIREGLIAWHAAKVLGEDNA